MRHLILDTGYSAAEKESPTSVQDGLEATVITLFVYAVLGDHIKVYNNSRLSSKKRRDYEKNYST